MEWENNYFKIIGSPTSLQINQKNSGAVIIATDNHKYLLIKIKRTDNTEHWEFPRGFSEKNETHEQTAIRELKEETNLSNTAKMTKLGEVMPDSGLINVKIVIILINLNFNQQIKLQKSEKIFDYKLVTLNQLKQMIANQDIIDSFTLAAYAKLISIKN